MINKIVDSFLKNYSKIALDVLKNTSKTTPKPPKRIPLPISTGLPERLPIMKSFAHIVFPRSFEHTYRMKREFLQKTRETPLPFVEVSDQTCELILKSSVTELLHLLNEDKVTSEQLVYTFMSRCQTIGIDNNYITDLNIEEAFEDAKRCDRLRKETPHNQRHRLGKLFGIPISLKENIMQRGFDATAGLATKCFSPANKDSLAAELLRKEGAILFARSTVPQLLSVIETVSNIWGRADNPWDRTRSTGGSSGGEAGLITLRCSPAGIGTDGLGSLRIPANWCGIYSFKPTSNRLSWKHSMVMLNYLSESRWSILHPAVGPMAKSIDDLALLTKCLTAKENRKRNPHNAYVEWNDKATHIEGRLKIGYVLTEEMFDSNKAARRAVLEAIEELKNQGHEVEEIKIPKFSDSVRIALALLTSDGMSVGNLLALNGERMISEMRMRMLLSFIPRWFRRYNMRLLRSMGEERAAFLGNWTAGLTGDQWMWILHEKDHIEQEIFNFWNEKELDAVITPATALPALKHGTSGELALNCCYLWISNMFNLPAGIVPVTRVEEGEDHYTKEDSVFTRDMLYRQAVDAMEGTKGLPVGIQVLTLPYEDEKCIGVMRMLEKKFPAMTKPDEELDN